MCDHATCRSTANERNICMNQKSVARVHRVETDKNFDSKHQALVAQDILDTGPLIFFEFKTDSLLKSYVQNSKCMKLAKCSQVPPLWFEPIAEED